MRSSTRNNLLRCVSVFWNGDLSARVVDEWRQLLVQDPHAPIFAYPEWVSVASDCKIATPRRVVIVYRDALPIALLPLYRQPFLSASALSFLAAEHASLIVDARYIEEAFSALAQWFTQTRQLRLVTAGPCDQVSRREHFHRLFRARQVATRERERSSTVWIDLPDSWEIYRNGLGSATRKSIKTAEKRLERDFPNLHFEIITEPSPASQAAVDALIRLYQMRWQDQVGGSIFHSERYRDFYQRALNWALHQGYSALPVLRLGERIIAVSSIFHIPRHPTAMFHMIARDQSVLSGYYAPGIYINMHSIRWAIARGIRSINIGSGNTEHKVTLGGREEPVVELSCAQSEWEMHVLPALLHGMHIVGRSPVHAWYHCTRHWRRKSGDMESSA